MSAVGAVAAGSAAIIMNSGKLFTVTNSGVNNSKMIPLTQKKYFGNTAPVPKHFYIY